MRSNNLKWVAIWLVILFIAIPIHALEIRGSVAGVDYSFTWNPQTFAGFDYDIDHDVGSETLTTTLFGNRLSGDYPPGIAYEASNQIKAFNNAKVDMNYGRLSVSTIDPTTGKITLDNRDNTITLGKDKDIEIMPGIFIKTADNDTLRYYIYKNVTQPGTYEIRSSVATYDQQWNPQNFAGFYYDINEDIGTETLVTTLSEGNNLSGDAPYGVTYTTTTQVKDYEFKDWGAFKVIGFLADRYFAGYVENKDNPDKNIMFKESTDEYSLSSEQLEKILIDEKLNMIVKKGESIKLKEGYELILKGVNSEGKIYLELYKDGSIVDNKVVSPSKEFATMMDKTYYFRNPRVGEQRNLVTIGVHFKNTYKDEELAIAIIDGIWQISDAPIDLRVDTQYGKMTINMIDANSGVIAMENKDNPITLTKKNDIELMPGIHIRTANNDTLRYYIYKTVTVGKAPA